MLALCVIDNNLTMEMINDKVGWLDRNGSRLDGEVIVYRAMKMLMRVIRGQLK